MLSPVAEGAFRAIYGEPHDAPSLGSYTGQRKRPQAKKDRPRNLAKRPFPENAFSGNRPISSIPQGQAEQFVQKRAMFFAFAHVLVNQPL